MPFSEYVYFGLVNILKFTISLGFLAESEGFLEKDLGWRGKNEDEKVQGDWG